MTATRAQLAQEFTNGEVRQFTGRGGQTFDYIEDETVMDRLDEVLGVGHWSIHVDPISVADGIVKVVLIADVDGVSCRFEDFGYASNSGPQAEGLKEAVSDGIRRCGRFLGVGRYLYVKHAPIKSAGRVAPLARPVARTSTDVPQFPDDYGIPPESNGTAAQDTLDQAWDAQARTDNTKCPEHGVTWNGEWGDLWHKTDDGAYCRHPENIPRGPRKTAGARR